MVVIDITTITYLQTPEPKGPHNNQQQHSYNSTANNMAALNIHHVQAKITTYLDLENCLQAETNGSQENSQNLVKLDTLKKITNFLLTNEDKWLNKDTIILYEIADNIDRNHYSEY